MSRVGMMTCFLDNCGACLQAYALQKAICSLGFDVEIIKFTEPHGYYSANIKNSSSIIDYIRCVKSREFRKKYYCGQYRRTAFNQFRKKYLSFSREEYKTYSKLESDVQKYDMYVCGSDQIWNPIFYDKCNPAYYLAFVDEHIPRIAYAPSIGINDIPAKYQVDFKKYVDRIDYISVREQKGVELIKKYTNREAKLVLDPTLLWDSEEWNKLVRKPRRKDKKKYVFCYLFGDNDYYSEVISRIIEKTNCEIRIFPVNSRDLNPFYQQTINTGPIEFLSLIKNAEFVLTDSFHATVFSLLFGKSFYVLKRDLDQAVDSMNSRIYSLLGLVGMEKRLLSQEAAINLNPQKISPEEFSIIHNNLLSLRIESMNYLKNALEGRK